MSMLSRALLAPQPPSRIAAMCSAVVFVLVALLVLTREEPNSEFPVELLVLIPFLALANLLAIVALFWSGKANKWLGLCSLVLIWGSVGAFYLAA